MTTSLVDAHTVIAVDIGSVNTRAFLFDTVDGVYRFIAAGSQAATPAPDVGEGMQLAIRQIQEITGRQMINKEGRLILPSQTDGSGFDRLVVTFSGGTDLRISTAGLLADVSLASACRLASMTGAELVESIGLDDPRPVDEQIGTLLRSNSDIVILAGGLDWGAARSVYRLAELVRMTSQVLPVDSRPDVLYAGNQALAQKIQEVFEKFVKIRVAPNLRPTVDVEDIGPARAALAELEYGRACRYQRGLQGAGSICSDTPLPASASFGRMIRFLSRIYDPSKGVLGVNLGAGSTTLAAGTAGKLAQVVTRLGMGSRLPDVLKTAGVEEIIRWIPEKIDEGFVLDYLKQKGLSPSSVPSSRETLLIEQAAARVILQQAKKQLNDTWPDLPDGFEPVMVSGSVLSMAPAPAQSLLMVLDGLQLTGMTTVMLDRNNLLPALGAVAKINPILPVQVIESNAFLNLGTVIAPVSTNRPNTVILKVRLEYEDGGENRVEVRQGGLVGLPLTQGRKARIHLQPVGRTRIDPKLSGGGSFRITGGACGVVIDGRGRPINLPGDAAQRGELMKKWMQALGG